MHASKKTLPLPVHRFVAEWSHVNQRRSQAERENAGAQALYLSVGFGDFETIICLDINPNKIEGMTMSEMEIKEACKEFIMSAFDLLNLNLTKGDDISHRVIEDVQFQDGHLTKSFYRNELDFDGFVKNNKEKIKELTEFSRCIKLSETLNIENFDKELFTLLVKISETLGKFEYNNEKFECFFSMFKDYLFFSELSYQITAPLISHNIKNMDLEDGLKIREITDEELQELWQRSRFGVISKNEILFFKQTLELEYKISKNLLPLAHQEKVEHLNELVTALRLFKKGGVSFSTYQVSPKGWKSRSNLDLSGFSMGLSKTSYGAGKYVLIEESEIEQFKQFWSVYKKIDFQNLKFLKMAINRFDSAYEKRHPEDKVIDYMISFESLFMKETQELRHRLSVRISRFLKDEYGDRKNLSSEFKKFYDIRSRIVHGESIDSKHFKKKLNELNVESISELIQKMEELLRESIKEFIDVINRDAKYDHEAFLEKLDLDKL